MLRRRPYKPAGKPKAKSKARAKPRAPQGSPWLVSAIAEARERYRALMEKAVEVEIELRELIARAKKEGVEDLEVDSAERDLPKL